METALALLDQYPWHRLIPLHVHPDFRLAVWVAVKERYCRGGDDLKPRPLAPAVPPETD